MLQVKNRLFYTFNVNTPLKLDRLSTYMSHSFGSKSPKINNILRHGRIKLLNQGNLFQIYLLTIFFLMTSLLGCYPERVESIKLMNNGIKEYQSGSSSAAVRYLARSAETDPTNHRALFYRGLILNEMGRLEGREDRFEDAVRNLKDSIAIKKDDPEVHYQLGVALGELERDDSALRAYEDAYQLSPHGEAAYRSGLIYQKLEKYNKAQDSFRKAIIAKPDLGIFEYAMTQMGNPCKTRVLMVGDNLHSDILGGNNFGIETCWLNTTGASVDERIAPSYTVESLNELKNILVA